MTRKLEIDLQEAERLYRKGWSYVAIAREMGLSPRIVGCRLKEHGVRRRPPSPAMRTRTGKILYTIWRKMRSRCQVPSAEGYEYYGARGIKVCAQWQSFPPFYEWAIAAGYQPGLRLARIRRSRDYTPGNCRWIEDREKRRRALLWRPSWKRLLTAFGETKGVKEWTRDRRCKVGYATLLRRLGLGHSPEDALSKPPRPLSLPPSFVRRGGGKRTFDWDRARYLHVTKGLSPPDIATRLGVSYAAVRKALRCMGVYRRPPAGLLRVRRTRLLYKIWHGMHRRCSNRKDRRFGTHGAHGIRVCREWATFEPFLAWAERSDYGPGLCFSRVDPAKGYSPSNCAWVRPAEAYRLKHPPRMNHPPRRLITAFGETKGLEAWRRDPRCQVTATSICQRLEAGWSPEEAIATPPSTRGIKRGFVRRELTAFGQTKSLTDWSRDRRCRVTLASLWSRLEQGMWPEEAITTPPYGWQTLKGHKLRQRR
ncbi:MAG: hypothetical protein AB1486_22525 [Planctomycetota bacterium]